MHHDPPLFSTGKRVPSVRQTVHSTPTICRLPPFRPPTIAEKTHSYSSWKMQHLKITVLIRLTYAEAMGCRSHPTKFWNTTNFTAIFTVTLNHDYKSMLVINLRITSLNILSVDFLPDGTKLLMTIEMIHQTRPRQEVCYNYCFSCSLIITMQV
jgi:hypothetical protein